ncbi:MAG: biotin/lipoyl-binding protein [Ruminococcaceae bacterium]|nr:biotin/lipoyl-binding protein [Oscillospiraceae bacterium]
MKKYNITVNGTSYEVIVEEVSSTGAVSAPVVTSAPVQAAPAAVAAPKATPVKKAPAAQPAGKSGSVTVNAPMPGTILDIKVSVGQSVKKGDTVCVLEAMKMENDIPAPQDGVIASVNVQKGASVGANDVLVTLS